MTKLISRAALCLAALPLIFTLIASPASVQTNTANATVVVNANYSNARRSPTPVVSTRAANRAVRANAAAIAYQPTPTPPAESTVRGRVFYADTGRPVKRASVMLMSEEIDGPASTPSAVTDGGGVFEMKNVRAGIYYAVVNAPGVVSPFAFVNFAGRGSGQSEKEMFAAAFANFEKIVIDGFSDAQVQVAARRGAAIGGRVLYDDGEPAAGVKVEILRKADDRYTSVVPNLSTIFSMRMGGAFLTDDRGVYRFSGLPPGEYIVRVTENAAHSVNAGRNFSEPFESMLGTKSYLTLFYPEAAEAKSAEVISVDYGQEVSEINFTLPSRDLFAVAGRVLARRDKRPVRARLTLSRVRENQDEQVFSIFDEAGGRERPSVTGDDGSWGFRELPRGKYKLAIEPFAGDAEYRSAIGDYSNANIAVQTETNQQNRPEPKFAKKAIEIVLDDKDLTDLTIELGGGRISGTVSVEGGGEFPPDVTVQAISLDDEIGVSDSVSNYQGPVVSNSNANVAPTVRTAKADREFDLENVVEGKNNFYVFLGGSDDYYVKSATLNGVDLLAAPFEIKEDDYWRGVRIVLGRDTGTLKGVVVSENKEAVKGVRLMLVPTDSRRRNSTFYRHATSSESGEFQVKLAAGEYAVIVFDQKLAGKNSEAYLKLLDELIKNAPVVRLEAGRTENLTVTRPK